jgi:hypothetical protein
MCTHERGHYEVQPNIEVLIKVLAAFRQTAVKLGVLMIKLGQFFSSRADLLPAPALAVLSTLKFVIWVVRHLVKPPEFIDLRGIYREFELTVYEAYTSRRVLELEWISGIKISDYAALEAEGIDRLEVAPGMGRLLYGQPFRIPAQFAFTGRAVSTLLGISTGQIEIRLAEEKNGRSRRGRRSRENEKSVGGFSYMVLFAVSLGAGCLFTNTYQVIPAGLLLGLAGLMGLRLLLRR